MSVSSKKPANAALIYVVAALACALFSAVYEHFSHGVWSYAMVYAFLYPLADGALPALLLGGRRCAGAGFWRAGVAALTVGSLFRGALEIYGTSHPLTVVYTILGAGLCGLGLIQFLFDSVRFSRYNKNTKDLRIKEGNKYEDHYRQP